MGGAYFGLLAEAEPGESHELALTVGQGVLGIDDGCHAGTDQSMCREGRYGNILDGKFLECRADNVDGW